MNFFSFSPKTIKTNKEAANSMTPLCHTPYTLSQIRMDKVICSWGRQGRRGAGSCGGCWPLSQAPQGSPRTYRVMGEGRKALIQPLH